MGSLHEQVFLPLFLCCSDSSKGKQESGCFGLLLLSTLLTCHQPSAFRRSWVLMKFSNFPTPTTWVICIQEQTTVKCTREVSSLTWTKYTATSTTPQKTQLSSKAKSLSFFSKMTSEEDVSFHLGRFRTQRWRWWITTSSIQLPFFWFYSALNKALPINRISMYKDSSEYTLVPHVPWVTLVCTSKTLTTLTVGYAYTL